MFRRVLPSAYRTWTTLRRSPCSTRYLLTRRHLGTGIVIMELGDFLCGTIVASITRPAVVMRWTTFACFIAHRHKGASRSPDSVTPGKIVMGERQPRTNVFRDENGKLGGSSSCGIYLKTGFVNCCEVEVSPFAVSGQRPLSLTVRIDPTQFDSGHCLSNSSVGNSMSIDVPVGLEFVTRHGKVEINRFASRITTNV